MHVNTRASSRLADTSLDKKPGSIRIDGVQHDVNTLKR